MAKRRKTNYVGVYYREVKRIGGSGAEKVYYIVFKKDGKTYEEKAGRQYVDAMTPARAAGIRAERIEGKRLSRKEIREKEKAQREAEQNRWTIDKLWEEYKRTGSNLKSVNREENSYKNHIKPYFGNKEPENILPLDIDRLRIKLLRAKKAPKTIAVTLELLQRAINFGVKKRLTKGLDFTIEMPKVNNLKTEDLTPEQLARLLSAIEEDIHSQAGAMMKMALFTGMRRGELFKLQWKHVDSQRGFINIRDPKGGPDQRIPLNDATRDLLESHLRTDSPYVFPGRDGKRRVNIKRAVNRIKEKAGLR